LLMTAVEIRWTDSIMFPFSGGRHRSTNRHDAP
jgi:hypothetical protein